MVAKWSCASHSWLACPEVRASSIDDLADWKYTRIYNPQRLLRVLVERCRKDSSQTRLVEVQSSPIGMVGKFGEGDANSDVILII
ncbi:hypothetical protein TNCV_4717581 [Trichonephila clavipes]|nr:hypothetical protein TNCV_4717581 [Trichonephila clavipes]